MKQIHLAEKAPIAFEGTKKIKSPQAFAASYNHNFRVGDTPANAQGERSHLNEEIISLEGRNYNQAFKDRIEEEGVRPRKDSVLGLEVVLVAQNTDDDFELSEWKKKSAEWLKNYFGKDNVVSAIYHGDESRPHIHAMVIPIVNGRLNCSEFTNGREKLTQMQTSYAEAVADLGLERGMERTPISYETMHKLRGATGKVAEETLPAPYAGEPVQAYFKRANKEYSDVRLKYFKEKNDITVSAEKAVEGIRREAEEKVSAVEQRYEEFKKSVNHILEENDALKDKAAKLEAELKATKEEYAAYANANISQKDYIKLTNLNKATTAINNDWCGSESPEMKRVLTYILNTGVDAYNRVMRERADQMTDRENGVEEDIDIEDVG